MMTKPPPKESAPTFNASQASAASPPVATTAPAASGDRRNASAGGTVGGVGGGRDRTAASISPQPTSTRARNGPTRAAAVPPASRYPIHRARAPVVSARRQLDRVRLSAAASATTGTAEP